MENVIICIPSKRKPPLLTLSSFHFERPVVVISDPEVYDDHRHYYQDMGPDLIVAKGKKGVGAQSAECYREAHDLGFEFFFRLDDDMGPKVFIDWTGEILTLDDAIDATINCANFTKCSLNGFTNTSRVDWLGLGYSRSYGLITGSAQLCRSCEDPSEFIDENLPIYADVYRSASHRKKDGAVGRVNWIGLEKRIAMRNSTIDKSEFNIELSKKIILGKFPDMVSCRGERVLDGGRQVIPNWRMKRAPTDHDLGEVGWP